MERGLTGTFYISQSSDGSESIGPPCSANFSILDGLIKQSTVSFLSQHSEPCRDKFLKGVELFLAQSGSLDQCPVGPAKIRMYYVRQQPEPRSRDDDREIKHAQINVDINFKSQANMGTAIAAPRGF